MDESGLFIRLLSVKTKLHSHSDVAKQIIQDQQQNKPELTQRKRQNEEERRLENAMAKPKKSRLRMV